jgi:hypothetical protein
MQYFPQGKLGYTIDSLSHESLLQIVKTESEDSVFRKGTAWKRILERLNEFEMKRVVSSSCGRDASTTHQTKG